jgi:hypothetical protein
MSLIKTYIYHHRHFFLLEFKDEGKTKTCSHYTQVGPNVITPRSTPRITLKPTSHLEPHSHQLDNTTHETRLSGLCPPSSSGAAPILPGGNLYSSCSGPNVLLSRDVTTSSNPFISFSGSSTLQHLTIASTTC